MRVGIVPCLADNYAYLLSAAGQNEAVVVDPSEAGPVVEALERERWTLAGILATHHHFDHVGGIEALLERFPGIPVFGHESDARRIPGLTRPLADQQRFEVAALELAALHVPGHTLGALTYVGAGVAFTGDTLFAAGCGRLFEGTAEQMYTSLQHKLARLPPDTLVYPGHEYTAQNLEFAAWLEPSNADVRLKAERVAALRARGAPSVPSSIGEELSTNPFLRLASAEIRAKVAGSLGEAPASARVFAAVRRAKDRF